MSTALTSVLWFPNQGVNLRDIPSKVLLTQASDLLNVMVLSYNECATRPGYTTAFASAVSGSPTITGLHSLYLSNGTKYELIVGSGMGIYKDDSTVATAKVMSGMNFSEPLDYAQFLDVGIFVDASGDPYTWNGSASGRITNAASASAAVSAAISCCTHLNKLFLAINNTSQFKYSATGTYSTWTGSGTNTVNVEQNNGQNIVALRSFARNELLIWKERSMFKYIGESSANFMLVQIDSSVGCISKKSIQVYRASTVGGVAIWADITGIYVYDGNIPKKISSLIQPLWDTINRNRTKWMVSTIDNDNGQYWLSFTTGSLAYNNVTLCVDMLHPWTDEDGLHFPIYVWDIPGQAYNSEITTDNTQRLVMGGYNNGKKYVLSTVYESDNGAAITSYVTTPLITAGAVSKDKCLRRIYIPAKVSDSTINVYTENKDGTGWKLVNELSLESEFEVDGIGDFAIGESFIGIPESSKINRIDMAVRGQQIKIKFETISNTERIQLYKDIEFLMKAGATSA